MSSVESGIFVDDRYEVVKTLGGGGFGTVYKAWQKQFERFVAVKILHSNLLQEADGLARFEMEARTIHGLRHKHIVSVYAYGVWQESPYMVMEFLEGRSLQDELLKGPIAPHRVVALMRQLFDALSCAHLSGVVHRDLKPANVMLTDSPSGELIKIIDFGLLKLLPGYGIASQKLTEVGFAVGTCHYMSPEQCFSAEVDGRSDIYAAGCIMYQCLVGCVPFDGKDTAAIMYQHIYDRPPVVKIASDPTGQYQALQDFVSTCLAKDPGERFSSAADAVVELDHILAGECSEKKRAQVSNAPFPSAKRRLPAGLAVVLGGFLVIAAIVAGAAVFYFRPFDPRSSELCDAIYGSIQDSYDLDTVSQVVPQLKRIVEAYERDRALDPRRAARVYKMLAQYEADTDDLVLGDHYAGKFMENKSFRDGDPSFIGIYVEYKSNSLIRQKRADEAETLILDALHDLPGVTELPSQMKWLEKLARVHELKGNPNKAAECRRSIEKLKEKNTELTD